MTFNVKETNLHFDFLFWRKIYFKLVSKDIERNDPIFKTAIFIQYIIDSFPLWIRKTRLPHNRLVTYGIFQVPSQQ